MTFDLFHIAEIFHKLAPVEARQAAHQPQIPHTSLEVWNVAGKALVIEMQKNSPPLCRNQGRGEVFRPTPAWDPRHGTGAREGFLYFRTVSQWISISPNRSDDRGQ